MIAMSVIQVPSKARIELPIEKIAALCERYGVAELHLFGSILRDDFRDDSDVDFMVRFLESDLGPWLGKLFDLENDLSTLLGRRVDLVLKDSVESSENYLRRKHILRTAHPLYVAR